MSLNFDTSKLDKAFTTRMGSDHPGVMEDPTKEYWSYEIEAIVWACIPVGLGEVTEANIGKWYERYVMVNLSAGVTEPYVTLEMLRQAIGLTTNVSNDTDAAFFKRIRARMQDAAAFKYRQAVKKLDEPEEDFGTL